MDDIGAASSQLDLAFGEKALSFKTIKEANRDMNINYKRIRSREIKTATVCFDAGAANYLYYDTSAGDYLCRQILYGVQVVKQRVSATIETSLYHHQTRIQNMKNIPPLVIWQHYVWLFLKG